MADYPRSTRAPRPLLLVASNNAHKVAEVRRILEPLGFSLTSPAELGIRLQVDETGHTFEQNALLKARAFSKAASLVALADDSGLCVDALGGEPGVFSARYGGEGLTDGQRCMLLLGRMRSVPPEQRAARFIACIALVNPSGRALTVEGKVEGVITAEPTGGNGFGYDPIFFYPPAGRTFAEMADAEKDAVSHRSAALHRLASDLSRGTAASILA